MAEFLIHAKESHWLDEYPKEIEKNKDAYTSRIQLGDIVVVRADSWEWGRCECLPDYLIVKVPGIDVDHLYETALYTKEVVVVNSKETEDVKIEKQRRFGFDVETIKATIDEIVNTKDIIDSVVEIDAEVFTNVLTTKINAYNQEEFVITKAVLNGNAT
jgi:hypothetical protein